MVEVSGSSVSLDKLASCSSLLSRIPHLTPFLNKTLHHHHRKTQTAIFAYFRKRSFSAPKTHNFCQLTKTTIFIIYTTTFAYLRRHKTRLPKRFFSPKIRQNFSLAKTRKHSHFHLWILMRSAKSSPVALTSSGYKMYLYLAKIAT